MPFLSKLPVPLRHLFVYVAGIFIYPPFVRWLEQEPQSKSEDTMQFLNSALLCLFVGAAFASTQNDNGIQAKKNSLRSATSANQKTVASTTAKNEADMFSSMLQPHSIQTFQLRPTSTLLFEGDDDVAENYGRNDNDESEKLNGEQRKLLQRMVDNAHGVYGALRHLSADDLADSVDDMVIDDTTRRLVAKHNQLLEQFNTERHLSRFARYERNMAVQRTRRQLDDQNKEEVDVDDAATAITEAAVETLYEGVLPVLTKPANVTETNEDLTEDASSASLCSANDRCVAQGLTGQCCPTNSGTYLACCPQSDGTDTTSSSAPDIIPPPPGSDVEAPAVSLSSPHEPESPIIDNAPVDPVMAEASAIIDDLFDGENPDMVDIIEEEHEEEEAFKEMAEAAGIIPVEEEEQLTGGRLNSYQTTPLGQGYGTHCKFCCV